ncbi:MAG: transglutaminase domain-containing protein [Chloroflexi bacterium]|nr:transglutaminase domain-containing protein [Chloroflexota bacterium]
MALDAFQHEKKVGEGVSTAALLVLMLLSVTGSIAAANWADGLGISAWAALAGLTLGLLLAKLPVRGWVAHPFMLVAGVPVVALLAGTLLPKALTLEEKLWVVQDRFWLWIAKATFGGVSTDNLMFIVQIAYLSWIMGYIAAWFVYRRHQVWGAIVPTGIAILFNLFYAVPEPGVYFALYILSALLLIVRVNLQTMERWWRGASIGYASDIGVDFLGYGAMFSVLLMVIAWLLPGTAPGPSWLSALEPLLGPWAQAEDEFNRVFGALRAVARPAPASYYGATLLMGGPVNLGNRPVMDIQTRAGRYWRAIVYDKYTGVGWINTHNDALILPANDSRLNASLGAQRVEISQTFKIFLPDQNILYAQSQPIEFDLPTDVRLAQPPATDANAFMLDAATIRARRTIRPGDTYSVVSAISVADEDSLRRASNEYSAWIAARYLQLPDDLPERVRTLAQTIAGKYSNAYDKAAAIERYLRAEIKYDDNVSAPPSGRDGVDYTLFERPAGYCNYYASAMAVLARSIGIPARVVSGYSLGDYAGGVFHVIEANAHSWVEVYFPGYGWIEFEPTASKPEIERPRRSENSLDDPDRLGPLARDPRFPEELDEPAANGAGSPFRFGSGFWSDPRFIALVATGGLVMLAVTAAGAMRWNRMRRQARLAPAARFYAQLLGRMRWFGVAESEHATPFERARAMGAALPKVRQEVEHATALYVREKFGAQPLDASEETALAEAWVRVRAAWWRELAARIVRGAIKIAATSTQSRPSATKSELSKS